MNEEQTTNENAESVAVIEESPSVTTAEVWRRNMLSMAYVAASTLLAYALVASFALIAD